MALTIVPIAGQSLLGSRDLVANNFNLIQTCFALNHSDFGAGGGKHNFLTIPRGGAHLNPGTDVSLYASVGATSGTTELIFRREGSGDEVPFTEHVLGVGATSGWTMLPSGMLMNFGRGDTGAPLAFAKPFKAGTLPFVTITLATSGEKHTTEVSTLTNANFTAYAYDMSQHAQIKQIYYIAIGTGV